MPEVPVLSLSAEPTLQIGVLDGDPDYLFERIVSTLHLPSGRIAVSDAGASEVSVYGPDGTFIRRWGGRGGGPGEFRALSRIYSGGDGSILALDAWTGRVSVFDTSGSFSHQIPAGELSQDTVFPLDVWLYGRFWVDGGLEASARRTVRDALDARGARGQGRPTLDP
ncbi:MAG: 6-bladed beta-propeller [Gemmatimonadota bacterium]